MGISRATSLNHSDRVRQTVDLLHRRGFALGPRKLGELCAGGPLTETEVRWAVAANSDLAIAEDLVVDRADIHRVDAINRRATAHPAEARPYLEMAAKFTRTLVRLAPFIRSVSIAGSLATGGFRSSDDVDLNLVVDDGHRHLAYVAVNLLGMLHALAHRSKPVDDLTRRPIAPRLMTANLILERSQCHPLLRRDEDMAFELLVSEPLFGADEIDAIVDSNPELSEVFPQLALKGASLLIDPPTHRLPLSLVPRSLDGVARRVGETAWRYMQWTRRNSPEALARVAYVRSTMRPYTLFDGQGDD
ncbi:MAG TPA: hypothetical protein VEW68_05840 [Patescibacteria group bacterium]|nr:hypothetical protein [Patescibacteria group bacterium]